MADLDSPREVDVNGETYMLHPGPVRQSLGEDAPMMWGFHFQVHRDGEMLGIKTCFVGRVSVQTSQPDALNGGMQDLAPVKVVEQLEEGDTGDEIIFS